MEYLLNPANANNKKNIIDNEDIRIINKRDKYKSIHNKGHIILNNWMETNKKSKGNNWNQ